MIVEDLAADGPIFIDAAIEAFIVDHRTALIASVGVARADELLAAMSPETMHAVEAFRALPSADLGDAFVLRFGVQHGARIEVIAALGTTLAIRDIDAEVAAANEIAYRLSATAWHFLASGPLE